MSTMIICADAHLAEEVERVVRGPKAVVRDVRGKASLPSREIRAYVVVHRWIDRTAVDELQALQRTDPGKPVILVTSPDPEHLRRLCQVRVAGIVWLNDLIPELPRVLATVGTRSLAMELATHVRQAPHATQYPHLVNTIELISRAGPPVPSTPQFAAMACASDSTLRRHLRALLGQDWTPHALLESVGVLIALDLVRQGWRLGDLHHQLGVHEDTLRSWARKHYDASLRELCEHPELALQRVLALIATGENPYLTEFPGKVDGIFGGEGC